MKQTAVEWYNQQLVDRQNGHGYTRSRDEIYEQAKEMEKEQIMDAFEQGHTAVITSERYYNQTFKSE
jgi:hypothetical protein